MSPTPVLNLSLNVTDLTDASQLISLLQEGKPAFAFGSEIADHWNAPIQAVPNGTETSIVISGGGSWKTGTGVCFGLSGGEKASLKVITSGPAVGYSPTLSSPATSTLPADPYAGFAYIKLYIDFQVNASVAAGANADGFGIFAKVKGSSDTSVTFSRRVPGGMNLSDAIKDAFEHFVFATDPGSATTMNAGDISQINFNGTLKCLLDVSYGIKTVKFSAPGVASTLESSKGIGAQFRPPSATVAIGATASLQYNHSDDFTAIVEKTDAEHAFLYILRAHKNETVEGLSLTATVTITNTPKVILDPKAIKNTVEGITGGFGGDQAAAAAPEAAEALTSQLNSWINAPLDKGVSLAVAWDQQKTASLLFKYDVNLAATDLVKSSWNALCAQGDLPGAVSKGGLVPEAGSGVSTELSDSFTTSLHFFNLFQASDRNTYFSKTYVTVGDNGTLRYNFDIGEESEVDVQKAKAVCAVHFSATVDATTAQTVSSSDVNLELEIIATNNQREAERIAALVGFIAPNQQVDQAQKAIQTFAGAHPAGSVNLTCILSPGLYGKLSSSEFAGGKPPADLTQDSANWVAFQQAAEAVLSLPPSFKSLTYQTWEGFNIESNNPGATEGTPNRRSQDGWTAIPPDFWTNISQDPPATAAFLLASGEFMNLCDDLHQLAGLSSTANSSGADIASYNALLTSLVNLIVKQDINNGYSKAAIAAVLKLTGPQTSTAKLAQGKNSVTCTLNFA